MTTLYITHVLVTEQLFSDSWESRSTLPNHNASKYSVFQKAGCYLLLRRISVLYRATLLHLEHREDTFLKSPKKQITKVLVEPYETFEQYL